jgi:hypothetical protein
MSGHDSNFGDVSTITNTCAKSVTEICTEYQGNTNGAVSIMLVYCTSGHGANETVSTRRSLLSFVADPVPRASTPLLFLFVLKGLGYGQPGRSQPAGFLNRRTEEDRTVIKKMGSHIVCVKQYVIQIRLKGKKGLACRSQGKKESERLVSRFCK